MRKRKTNGSKQAASWGSGSPTAKKTEKRQRGMGDFGSYMSDKQRKLTEQFHGDKISLADKGNRLFEDVSIHVNGYTTPSHQELRSLMVSYGGNFENYFAKARVTHIICSNIPDSKLRAFSKGLPIVRPEWVIDSIAAGKVLPCSKYQLAQTGCVPPQQLKLLSFFGSGSISGESEAAATDATASTVVLEEHRDDHGSTSHVNSDCQSDGNSPEAQSPDIMDQTEDVDSHVVLADQRRGFSGSITHSTLGDANFVQNYFKSSRLHFIGTWRNRYQMHSERHGQRFKEKLEADQSHIIHIDMDCFFVSAVTRNRSDLQGKPVAVCHSENSRGTAEISSANYEARAFGVKAGMFVRDAKSCCPDLEIVPYDFEGYEQVAEKLYEILHQKSDVVQAISCDEAYIDVTGLGDPVHIASTTRQEIFEATRCTASAGISSNILLARLATRKAKPNGLYEIRADQATCFISDVEVGELPGVGRSLREKLHQQNIRTCTDLCKISKEALQKDFGVKTGEMLWSYARGIDHRKVQPAQERKSVGAEVNWGVRFNSDADAQHFLISLCEEVSTRLQKAAFRGRTFSLKIKKRKEGAEEPVKFMGCGICDNISRSVSLTVGTDKSEVLLRVARQLFTQLSLDVRDIRGIGLQVTKLEPVYNQQNGNTEAQKNLEAWISNTKPEQQEDSVAVGCTERKERSGDKPTESIYISAGLPPVSQLDRSVLESLPPELFSEINQAYNGALKPGEASTSTNFRNEMESSRQQENILHRQQSNWRKDMWLGSPPQWMNYFQSSHSSALRAISERYSAHAETFSFAEFLLGLKFLHSEDGLHDECVELIYQYVQMICSYNLEEVANIMHVVNRLASQTDFWKTVQQALLPQIQDIVLQVYGGILHS